MEILWRLMARVIARPAVASRVIERAKKTPYSHIYSDDGALYMERYWLFNAYDKKVGRWAWLRDRLPSARVHCIRRPDIDRHPHNHPWFFRTLILRGAYVECREVTTLAAWNSVSYHYRHAGTTTTMGEHDFHSITAVEPETWTLFITWKYLGTWGFRVNGDVMPWREYKKAYKTKR
jgi:hypothetical protein